MSASHHWDVEPTEAPPLSHGRPGPSILKAEPKNKSAAFSFQRDVLSPFSLHYASTASASLSQDSTFLQSSSPALTSSLVGSAAAVAGGIWGSAIKTFASVTGDAQNGKEGHGSVSPNLAERSPEHPEYKPRHDTGHASGGNSEQASDGNSEQASDRNSKQSSDRNSEQASDRKSAQAPEQISERRRQPQSPRLNSSDAHPREIQPRSQADHSPDPLSDPSPKQSLGALKRARFQADTLKVVYPINVTGHLPPLHERQVKSHIDASVRGLRAPIARKTWTPEALRAVYSAGCRANGTSALRAVYSPLQHDVPSVLSVADTTISVDDAEALADLLSIDFGLTRLSLRNCRLTHASLKPLLHALLLSDSVCALSLAGNDRAKLHGWRMICAYVFNSLSLTSLDLADVPLERSALHMLAVAIREKSGNQTLRDANGHGNRSQSEDQNGNPSENNGPDAAAADNEPNKNTPSRNGTPESTGVQTGTMTPQLTMKPQLDWAKHTLVSLRLDGCGSLNGSSLEILAKVIRDSNIKNLSLRRNRINDVHALALLVQGPLALLDLRDNRIGSARDLGPLGAALAASSVESVNLSLNSIDEVALLSFADAAFTQRHALPLKTLDLSQNPCGSASAGLSALARGFVRLGARSRLERLFFADTGLTSEGAITLAEAIPSLASLRHLDLTHNAHLDIAGMMALAAAIKLNTSICCLDIHIPPNEPVYARISQAILQTCAENMDRAERQEGEDEEGGPEKSELQKSGPEKSGPEKSGPEKSELQKSEPQKGEPQEGEHQQGQPQQDEPQQGQPQQDEPQQGQPQQGQTQEGESLEERHPNPSCPTADIGTLLADAQDVIRTLLDVLKNKGAPDQDTLFHAHLVEAQLAEAHVEHVLGFRAFEARRKILGLLFELPSSVPPRYVPPSPDPIRHMREEGEVLRAARETDTVDALSVTGEGDTVDASGVTAQDQVDGVDAAGEAGAPPETADQVETENAADQVESDPVGKPSAPDPELDIPPAVPSRPDVPGLYQ